MIGLTAGNGQPVVGEVVPHWLFFGSFRVAGGLTNGSPALAVLPVGIGDDDPGARSGQVTEHLGLSSKGGAEQHRSSRLDQSLTGRRYQTFGVASQDDGPFRVGDAQDPNGIQHRKDYRLVRIRGSGRPGQRVFVKKRPLRPSQVGDRFTKADRLTESGSRSQVGPQVGGSRRTEPLVLQVGSEHHVACPQQPGEGSQPIRVKPTLLDLRIEGHHEGRRSLGTQRNQLPGGVRPIHQAREKRVTRVAPPVGGEIRTWYLQHAGVVGPGIQVGGGLVPVVRNVFRALDQLTKHFAPPHGRQVCHNQHAGHQYDRTLEAGSPTGYRFNSGTQENRRTQHGQGQNPWGAAQGQSCIGQSQFPEEATQRGRGVVGVGAHADQ